jgi:hypothetical protein
MIELDRLKAVPGAGIIGAFIVIVILFLRYLERVDGRVDSMAKMFSDQVQEFFGEMLEVSQSVTTVIKGLEDALRDLRGHVRG